MDRRLRVCLSLLLALIAGCDRAPVEKLENRYERADSPEASEARRSGLLPLWIPDGATELREAHDPATQESLVLFREPNVLVIPYECDVTDAAGVVKPTLAKPWWPSAEVLGGSRMMFYRCPPRDDAPRMFIALASGEPWVYVWSTFDRRPR